MIQTVEKREYEASLPCTLTKKERLEFADKLGGSAENVEAARRAKGVAAKRLKAAEEEYTLLSTIVSSGIEYRDIPVKVMLNFDTGRAQHVRADTGEVLVERSMTEDERQLALPAVGEGGSHE